MSSSDVVAALLGERPGPASPGEGAVALPAPAGGDEAQLWDFLSSRTGNAISPALRIAGKNLLQTLQELHPNAVLRAAALLLPAVRAGALSVDQLRAADAAEVAAVISDTLRLHFLDALHVAHHHSVFDEIGHIAAPFVEDLLPQSGGDHAALLLKLGDALCTLRRRKRWTPQGRVAARRVMRVYTPLADRLAVASLRRTLELEAFVFLYPRLHAHCLRILSRRYSPSVYPAVSMGEPIALLRSELAKQNIRARVTGRIKSVPAILEKMYRKSLQLARLEEVHDVRALRVIVTNSSQCYRALKVVHSLWKRVPEEFDDYIKEPKKNGYQALHTTVQDTEEKFLEVQIRTEQMHVQAEFGVCAHWRYKEMPAEERRRLDLAGQQAQGAELSAARW